MAPRFATALLGALLVAVAAGSLASSADAAATALWPGVTYRSTVELTPRGPVAIHVITGPRPGGLTTLEPLLSNDSVLGRETVTSMQRRVTDGVTAGVNADFSRFDNGKLSGIFMRNGDLAAPPNPRRSSVGILSDGTLDVRRVSLRGTWRGTAPPPALPPQRAAGRRRRGGVGACLRQCNTRDRRRDGGDPLPVSARHAGCRSGGDRRGGRRRERSGLDPDRWRGAPRLGCPGAGTFSGGARRLAGLRPARLQQIPGAAWSLPWVAVRCSSATGGRSSERTSGSRRSTSYPAHRGVPSVDSRTGA